MKKLLFPSLITLCLAACYCQQQTCTSCTQMPAPQTGSVIPPVSEISPLAAPAVSPHTTKQTRPQASVSPIPASSAADTPVTALAPTDASLTPPVPAQEQPLFTAEQANILITNARAAQSLPQPPADMPVFKKEDSIPLTNRLISPLAYEPVRPDTTHAPWRNESLKYGIYYSFVKAGTAYIKTRGITEYNGKQAYLIQTTAFSASVIDTVFKVRDINYSWLDVQNLHSLGYSQSLREGNYVRDEWVLFDPDNHRYYGQVRKKSPPRTIAGELDHPVLDMLTSLYYVRSQPLQEGHDITFDIINREERYPLLVKVTGKETVKTPAGKFNCWIVEPQFRGEGIFVAKGKSLKVWLTDDAYRMPVKMSVEVFIGSVSAELLEYRRN